MRRRRPCLECGRPTFGSRCSAHDPRRVYRSARYRVAAAAFIDEHVASHGWWCPGAADVDHDPHPSRDLTVDHLVEVAAGADLMDVANWRVLCRGANRDKAMRRAEEAGYPGGGGRDGN